MELTFKNLLRLVDRVGAWITVWISATHENRNRNYNDTQFAEKHLTPIEGEE